MMNGIHSPMRSRYCRPDSLAVLVFCVLFIWYSRNTGAETFLGEWMPFIMAGVAFLVGIPVYLRQKAHMTEPGSVPAYR